MLNKIIGNLFLSALSDILENISPSDLKDGTIKQGQQLKIKQEFIDQIGLLFGIPLQLIQGTIQEYSMEIPWNNFQKKHSKLIFKNVQIVVRSKAVFDKVFRKLLKQSKIEKDLLLHDKTEYNKYDNTDEALSFGAKLKNLIILNLELEIENFEFRFEDQNLIQPKRDFKLGLFCKQIKCMQMASGFSLKQIFDPLLNQRQKFLQIEFHGLLIFYEYQSNHDKVNNDFFLRPMDIIIKINYNYKDEGTHPESQIHIDIDEVNYVIQINLNISNHLYEFLQRFGVFCTWTDHFQMNKGNYPKFNLPIKNNARIWWQYALKSIRLKQQKSKENFRIENLEQRRLMRNEYIFMHQIKLLICSQKKLRTNIFNTDMFQYSFNQKIVHNSYDGLLNDLKAFEQKFFIDETIFYRNKALENLKKNNRVKQIIDEQNSFSQVENKGKLRQWFDSFSHLFSENQDKNSQLNQTQMLLEKNLQENISEEIYHDTKLILNIDQIQINLDQDTKSALPFHILQIQINQIIMVKSDFQDYYVQDFYIHDAHIQDLQAQSQQFQYILKQTQTQQNHPNNQQFLKMGQIINKQTQKQQAKIDIKPFQIQLSFELIQSLKYFCKVKDQKLYNFQIEQNLKDEHLRNPLQDLDIDIIIRNVKINLGANRNLQTSDYFQIQWQYITVKTEQNCKRFDIVKFTTFLYYNEDKHMNQAILNYPINLKIECEHSFKHLNVQMHMEAFILDIPLIHNQYFINFVKMIQIMKNYKAKLIDLNIDESRQVSQSQSRRQSIQLEEGDFSKQKPIIRRKTIQQFYKETDHDSVSDFMTLKCQMDSIFHDNNLGIFKKSSKNLDNSIIDEEIMNSQKEQYKILKKNKFIQQNLDHFLTYFIDSHDKKNEDLVEEVHFQFLMKSFTINLLDHNNTKNQLSIQQVKSESNLNDKTCQVFFLIKISSDTSIEKISITLYDIGKLQNLLEIIDHKNEYDQKQSNREIQNKTQLQQKDKYQTTIKSNVKFFALEIKNFVKNYNTMFKIISQDFNLFCLQKNGMKLDIFFSLLMHYRNHSNKQLEPFSESFKIKFQYFQNDNSTQIYIKFMDELLFNVNPNLIKCIQKYAKNLQLLQKKMLQRNQHNVQKYKFENNTLFDLVLIQKKSIYKLQKQSNLILHKKEFQKNQALFLKSDNFGRNQIPQIKYEDFTQIKNQSIVIKDIKFNREYEFIYKIQTYYTVEHQVVKINFQQNQVKQIDQLKTQKEFMKIKIESLGISMLNFQLQEYLFIHFQNIRIKRISDKYKQKISLKLKKYQIDNNCIPQEQKIFLQAKNIEKIQNDIVKFQLNFELQPKIVINKLILKFYPAILELDGMVLFHLYELAQQISKFEFIEQQTQIQNESTKKVEPFYIKQLYISSLELEINIQNIHFIKEIINSSIRLFFIQSLLQMKNTYYLTSRSVKIHNMNSDTQKIVDHLKSLIKDMIKFMLKRNIQKTFVYKGISFTCQNFIKVFLNQLYTVNFRFSKPRDLVYLGLFEAVKTLFEFTEPQEISQEIIQKDQSLTHSMKNLIRKPINVFENMYHSLKIKKNKNFIRLPRPQNEVLQPYCKYNTMAYSVLLQLNLQNCAFKLAKVDEIFMILILDQKIIVYDFINFEIKDIINFQEITQITLENLHLKIIFHGQKNVQGMQIFKTKKLDFFFSSQENIHLAKEIVNSVKKGKQITQKVTFYDQQ